MKVFETTIQAVKNFDEVMQNAHDEFRNEKKKIMDTYKDPTKKLSEIRDCLVKTESEQKQLFREILRNDFEQAEAKLNNLVTGTIPADFPATLEVVRASGRNITDYEARAMMEKYRSSYMAYRTLVEVLHQNGKAENVVILKPDRIMAEMHEVKQFLENWNQNYTTGKDYTTALFKHHTNPLTKLADRVQVFLDGGYDVSTN